MKGANPFFVPEISDGTPEDGKMNSENGLPHFDDIPMFGGSISNFGKFIWWSQLILQQLTSPTSGPPSCWTNQGFASASCGNARAMAPIPLNHDLMPKQTCIPYKCVSNICASPKNAYIHKKHYSIFMNDVCVCVRDRLCFFVRGIPIVVSSFHHLKTCPPHHSDLLLEKSSLRQRAGLHDPCLAISPPSAVISSDRRVGFQENLQYMFFTSKYRGVQEIFPSNSLESLAISGI